MDKRRAGRASSHADPATDRPAVLDLERYVPGLLTFVANKLSRSASQAYAERFGVNVTEWRILSQLAIEPGIPAARICQVIGFDKGPVSRTLGALERRGLVLSVDDPEDARRRRVSLTAEGRALHNRILPVALERERRLLACLGPEERDTLLSLLGTLHRHLPDAIGPEEDG